MNDAQNPNFVGVLSEIDRLGQKVLDAIWTEDRHRGPHYEKVHSLITQSEVGNHDGVLEEVQTLLGLDSTADVVKWAMEDFRVGNERAQAVRDYIAARNIYTTLGL